MNRRGEEEEEKLKRKKRLGVSAWVREESYRKLEQIRIRMSMGRRSTKKENNGRKKNKVRLEIGKV